VPGGLAEDDCCESVKGFSIRSTNKMIWGGTMRLGGPVFEKFEDADAWVDLLKKSGYSAAVCTLNPYSDDVVVDSYARAAEKAGIAIAEVGAWSNPLSNDKEQRRQAIEYCQKQLALAERIGAGCCVNIAGSRGPKWDGPHPDNLTDETFDMVVDTIRNIIDAVKPKRTFYALETMPWIFPDSPESYLKLILAIDRKAFAVHLDPVNLICSPQRYFNNARLISQCFKLLGPYVKSCHAKDILLRDDLTVHLDEVRPGLGFLDYRTYIREIERLNPQLPLLLEHLAAEEEYRFAARYIRRAAEDIGVVIL
jgi:sugar phosphate isomerase/epimerase